MPPRTLAVAATIVMMLWWLEDGAEERAERLEVMGEEAEAEVCEVGVVFPGDGSVDGVEGELPPKIDAGTV